MSTEKMKRTHPKNSRSANSNTREITDVEDLTERFQNPNKNNKKNSEVENPNKQIYRITAVSKRGSLWSYSL